MGKERHLLFQSEGGLEGQEGSRHHPSIQPTTNSSRDSGGGDDDDDAGDGGDGVVRQRRANPERERDERGGLLSRIPMA